MTYSRFVLEVDLEVDHDLGCLLSHHLGIDHPA
jgi:hypothetical protein